jgi:hypothetical protein
MDSGEQGEVPLDPDSIMMFLARGADAGASSGGQQ